MNLYLITQDVANDYDTYDSAVVAAPSAKAASLIHPHHAVEGPITDRNISYAVTWVTDPKDVKVTYLGRAAKGVKKGVVLASFNAG